MCTLPQVEEKTNVVVEVYYLLTGVNGEHTVSIQSIQQFALQEAFTPYSELTEAQVISWADPQTMSSLQDTLQGQINSLKSPPVLPASQPLPW
jgi:hypothetical protein